MGNRISLVAAVLLAVGIGYLIGNGRSESSAGRAQAGPVWDVGLNAYVTDGNTLTLWEMKDGHPIEARTYALSSSSSKPDEKGQRVQRKFLTFEVYGGPATELGKATEPGK